MWGPPQNGSGDHFSAHAEAKTTEWHHLKSKDTNIIMERRETTIKELEFTIHNPPGKESTTFLLQIKDGTLHLSINEKAAVTIKEPNTKPARDLADCFNVLARDIDKFAYPNGHPRGK